MKVYTNNHERQFKYRCEVQASILASDFDYLDEDEGLDGFLEYRNVWYHLSSFMSQEVVPGFSGFAADSFFSGVAIDVSNDGETYRIATVIS